MFRALLIGIWGCLIAAGSSYAVVFMHNRKTVETPVVSTDKLERRKGPPMTVPVVVEGKMQGYLLVQLALLGPAQALKAQSVPPEVLMTNEAFKILFSDTRVDFRHLDKYDLAGLTRDVADRLKKRVGDGVVTEVMVDDFNYVSKDDLRK